MGDQHHHPKLGDTAVNLPTVRSGERRRLMWVMVLTGVTMIAELVGGWIFGSLALLGDGVHMFTHLMAVGISYFAIVIALRPAAPEKTYRNWRAEILGALFSGVALLPLAGYVIYEAIQRFRDPGEIDVLPMLGVAFIGLVVNIVCAMVLHGHSKEDLNVRGAFLHMVADSASSVGVLVAGTAILIWGDAVMFLDPLAAMLISLMILIWAVGLLRSSCRILLEGSPPHVDLKELTAAMTDVEGICDVHDLHVWTITSKMHALTAHVRFERDMPLSQAEKIGLELEKMIDEKYHINHATFQFEFAEGRELACEHAHQPTAGHSHDHTHGHGHGHIH